MTKKIKLGITISTDKFIEVMDKTASDSTFRERLDKQPVETLKEIGIELNEETRSLLEGKPLSAIIGPTPDAPASIQAKIGTKIASGIKSAAITTAKNVVQ